MFAFIADHLIEIFFGLVSAGALAFCKRTYKQMNDYKRLLEEQERSTFETLIDNKIIPVKEEINVLHKEFDNFKEMENHHLTIIVSSYRYRLLQLCKDCLAQKYMTPDQYDQISEFYKLYSSLGGNGQAKAYYEKTISLPIREEEH